MSIHWRGGTLTARLIFSSWNFLWRKDGFTSTTRSGLTFFLYCRRWRRPFMCISLALGSLKRHSHSLQLKLITYKDKIMILACYKMLQFMIINFFTKINKNIVNNQFDNTTITNSPSHRRSLFLRYNPAQQAVYQVQEYHRLRRLWIPHFHWGPNHQTGWNWFWVPKTRTS